MFSQLSVAQQYPSLSLPSWNDTLNGVNPQLRSAIERSTPPINNIFGSDAAIYEYRYLTGVGAPLLPLSKYGGGSISRSIVTIDRTQSRIGEAGNGTFNVFFYDNGVPGAPAIFYLHPGGIVGGTTTSNEHHLVELSKETGAKIFSPEYRLIPENPTPAVLLDNVLAVDYIQQHATKFKYNPDNSVIYGASAGADQALMAAGALQELNPSLNPPSKSFKGIYMNYPAGYLTPDQASFKENNPPVWFSIPSFGGLVQNYLAPSDLATKANPIISAIKFASDVKDATLAMLPSISLVVGEKDLLRSGGEALYQHLQDIKHPSSLDVRKGDCHISIEQYPDVPLSAQGRHKLAQEMKKSFGN